MIKKIFDVFKNFFKGYKFSSFTFGDGPCKKCGEQDSMAQSVWRPINKGYAKFKNQCLACNYVWWGL